jgi:hypothetical protein
MTLGGVRDVPDNCAARRRQRRAAKAVSMLESGKKLP